MLYRCFFDCEYVNLIVNTCCGKNFNRDLIVNVTLIFLCVLISFFLSSVPSLSASHSPYLCLSFSLLFFLSVCLTICLFIHHFVYLHIFLTIYPAIYPGANLSRWLSVLSFFHPSFLQFILLFSTLYIFLLEGEKTFVTKNLSPEQNIFNLISCFVSFSP